MLQGKPHAYVVFGVEDGSHKIVGTSVRLKNEKHGNEPFENWVQRKLDPRITLAFYPFDYKGKHIELIAISASINS